jgi:AcrR family transcriptional regulator
MAARKYEQRIRAATAEETRRRILDALYERVAEAPSAPVSIEQIAQTAGVSRPTVYTVFGSRAGLFGALGVELLRRGGFDEMMAATMHPDALEGLRGGISAEVKMWAAHRDVLRNLFSMAQLDPEAVGGAVHNIEAGRALGASYRAQRLADQKLLRPGVSVEEAADVIWVLTSFESFDLLHARRGLALDVITHRLVAMAERALLR